MPLNVLVIDRSPPVDRLQGNSLIGVELFRRLQGHRLTLVAPGSEDERSDVAALRDVFSEVVLVPRRTRVAALSGALETRLSGLPFAPGLDVAAARALGREVARLTATRSFDLVHVRQLPMARYGQRFPGGRLLELVDSETLGAERALPATRRTRLRASIARRYERAAMREYDAVTVVAEADAQRLRQLDRARRVEVVPNGVDLERYAPLRDVSRERDLLVFVGAMSFAPNVVAMRYFCHDVMPAVRRAREDVRLLIVGRDPAPEVVALGALDGVEVVGEVADVQPYLSRAAVFVAPMLSGSGIKNKVLEAFAAECAVVATPLAIEGLPVTDGREVRIAEGADAIATATVGLLEEPATAERIGREARSLVERRYTWDACAATYEALYREVSAAGRGRRGILPRGKRE